MFADESRQPARGVATLGGSGEGRPAAGSVASACDRGATSSALPFGSRRRGSRHLVRAGVDDAELADLGVHDTATLRQIPAAAFGSDDGLATIRSFRSLSLPGVAV